jgi:hypothetical protein
MVTKEMLHAEIDRLTEEQLADAYADVLRAARKRGIDGDGNLPVEGEDGHAVPGKGALLGLFDIRIDAPADFAQNLDLYVSGEKNASDIR